MPRNYVVLLKCDLTDAEIADTARDLARANSQKKSIEDQKKEVDAQLKADIAAQDSIIGRLSALINTGHEYRNIECRIELDTPESGKKTIIRLDTGEIVNVKPMTDEDRQMALDLQTEAEAATQKEADERAKAEAEKVIVTPPPDLRLIEQATRPDSMLYPLRLLRQVKSDLPFGPRLVAEPRLYSPAEIDINPHGAVSVKIDGEWLGIKPEEMEWVFGSDPNPEVMMSSEVAQQMVSDAIDLHGGLASALQMGGTHQKRKRGKDAAAGDAQ